jgi:hypothetical protein
LINQDRKISDVVSADVRIRKHTEFIEKAIMLRDTAGLRKTLPAD